ncbi:MAG: hypothetical protein OEM52_07160 [bacterium]|nr:hypothetical protein [bacterium]
MRSHTYCSIRTLIFVLLALLTVGTFVVPVLANTEKYPRDKDGNFTLDAVPPPASNPPVIDAIGGPDGYGYRWIDNNGEPTGPTYGWIDISTTGTSCGITGDDQTSLALPIGFSFPFYGTSYTQFRVCTNGWITLNASETSTSYTNSTLPNATVPNNIIAPFWDDLISNNVRYQNVSGNLVVSWLGSTAQSGGTGTFDFQAILHPSGEIRFQYNTVGTPVNSATIGIENSTGTTGLQVVYNAAYVATNRAVRIYPDPNFLGVPTNPAPTDASNNVRLSPTLSWVAANNATGYHVYFGTTNPPMSMISFNQPGTSFVATDLLEGTTYYWRIVATNGSTTNAGAVWSFTTKSPDSYGYRWSDNLDVGGPSYQWIDLSSTGTTVYTAGDDSTSRAIQIGFPFNYYGTTYTHFKVCTNGWLTLDTTTTTTQHINTTIPATAIPNALIAPYWDDLRLTTATNSYLKYQTINANQLVVAWRTPHFSGTGIFQFEVILNLDGSILFQYDSVGTLNNSATIGIENGLGTVGNQIVYNSTYPVPGRVVKLTGPQPGLPATPSPINNATNQPFTNLSLSWSATNATGYDVYLATNNPPTTLVSTNQPITSFSAPTLSVETTYYWRIVARNASGTTYGPIWQFTTGLPIPSNPIPADEGSGVINCGLQWGRCVGATGYDVYYGMTNPPRMKVASNIPDTTFDPGSFTGMQRVYWRVVAKYGANESSGPIWSFEAQMGSTGYPELMSPIDHAEQIPYTLQLSWMQRSLSTYDVFLSTSLSDVMNQNPTARIAEQITDSYFSATNFLTLGQTYYWRVAEYSIPPGTMHISAPREFSIHPGLSGEFEIGDMAHATFNSALNDLTSIGVGSGGVTFNVRPGIYNENLIIPALFGSSPSNPVVFRCSSHDATIVPQTTFDDVVQLAGANWVTFDGVNISDLAAQSRYAFHLKNGASHITIVNSTMSATRRADDQVAILSNHSNDSEPSNSFNQFLNLKVSGYNVGARLEGIISRDSNNVIGSTTTNISSTNRTIFGYTSSIGTGIIAHKQFGFTVSDCDIRNVTMSTDNSVNGIHASYDVQGGQFLRNRIHNLTVASGTGKVMGINVFLNCQVQIANNVVYDLRNNAQASDFRVYGIYSEGTADLAHNTVVLECDSAFGSACVRAQIGAIRNNIFINASRSAFTPQRLHVIYLEAWQSGIIDHNVVYVPNPVGGGAAVNIYNPETLIPWSSWQTTSRDANSCNGDPRIYSYGPNLDYRLSPDSPALYRGASLSWVLTDIDSSLRNPVTPACGVDEPSAVKLRKPVGGDTLLIGQIDTVKYNVSGYQSIRVEWNQNYPNGNWQTLAANNSPTMQQHLWRPDPGSATTHARVRISSLEFPSLRDSSTSEFSLFESSLTLVNPSGGETLIGGSPYNIQWSSNLPGSVRLEVNYHYPEGDWQTITSVGGTPIAQHLPSTGSFLWNVSVDSLDPLQPSFWIARIRVVSESYPSSLIDSCNSNIRIENPYFNLIGHSPSDTIYWGYPDTLRWQSNLGGFVRVERFNGGTYPGYNWSLVRDSVPNTGEYVFILDSSALYTNYFGGLKISHLGSTFTTGRIAWDNVRRVLELVNPHNEMRTRMSEPIQWLPTGLSGNVRIEMKRSYPTEGEWQTLFENIPNDGYENWVVPAHSDPGNIAVRFRISSLEQTQYDYISQSFAIIHPIYLPQPSDTLFLGEPDTIQLVFDERITGFVNIKLNRAYPSPVWVTIAANRPATNHIFLWTPTGAVTENARIAIVPLSNPEVADTMVGNFSILNRQVNITYPDGGEQIVVGRPDSICWSMTYPTRFDIYLSRHGVDPVNLELIASNVSSLDGHCYWTPTAPLSDNSYIYIVDPNLGVDDWSDTPFRIVSSTITVTRPNDGEHFYFGLQDTIRWNSLNLSDNSLVAIDLRRGYTAQWENIVPSTRNTGVAFWTPNGVANQNSKIRIRSLESPAVWDTSDYTFNIENYSWLLAFLARNPNLGNLQNEWSPAVPFDATTGNRPPLEVTFPHQGTGHANPDTVSLSYRRIDSDELTKRINRYWDIEPSSENFQNAELTLRFQRSDLPAGLSDPVNANPRLISVYSNDGGLTWIFEPGGSCTVDNQGSDGNTFQYNLTGLNHMSQWALTTDGMQPVLTTPNGNDTLVIGTTTTIRWNNSIRGGLVTIQLNRNYPSGNWETILTNTPNDSLENWVVSGAVTSNARFRIFSELFATDGDTSNAATVIRNPGAVSVVTVTYPNGAESLRIGVTDTIRWSAPTLSGNVSIELKRNYPTGNWETLFSNTVNDGKQAWSISGIETTNGRIRIRSVTTPTTGDTSDANFEIYRRAVRITYPNSGEIVTLNVEDTIRWTSRDVTGNVQIKFTRNYPNPPWVTVPNGISVPVSQGYLPWTPTGTTTTNARVAIIPASYVDAADTSDGSFSIQDRALTLTHPNGGEVLLLNRADTIRWTATYTSTASLFLMRHGVNGTEEVISAVDTIPTRRGYFIWTPTGTLTDSAYIHIVDTYYGIEDWSDNQFRIVNSMMTVSRPNDGEVFYFGLPDTIRWTPYNITGNVAVDLRRTVTGLWETLFANQSNTGSVAWIPTGNSSISAKVRIRSLSNPAVYDTSDFPFSLTNYPWSASQLTVYNPNAGTNHLLAWTPTIPFDVSSNNLPPIEVSFPTQLNGYANPDSILLCYTMIAADALVSDRTIRRFWMTSPSSQQFQNASLALRFAAADVPLGISDPVTVYPPLRAAYSDNDGLDWVIQSGGTIVRDTGAISSYRFQLSSLSHLAKWSIVNSGLQPVITHPNGGERLLLGQLDTIRWSNNIRGGLVSIQINRSYPTGTWETLFASTPNDSMEVWTVSGALSTTTRIRIVSDWFTTDGDTSNTNFDIATNDPPAAPRNLIVTRSGDDAMLNWTRVDSSQSGYPIIVSGYNVYSRDIWTNPWVLRSSLIGTNELTWRDTSGVRDNSKRFYIVKAFIGGTIDTIDTQPEIEAVALPESLPRKGPVR